MTSGRLRAIRVPLGGNVWRILPIRLKWPSWPEYVRRILMSGVSADSPVRFLVVTLYSPIEPSSESTSRAAVHQQLVDWESNIPSELRLENASTPRAKFLAGLLHMTY